MQKLILSILIITSIFSCSENNTRTVKFENTEDNIEINELKQRTRIDTVLEISSSDELDMSIHQLYIDTTKTSRIYKNAAGKKASEDEALISEYIHGWDKRFKFKTKDYKAFPRKWRTIRKKGNEFYLYDRCDGGDFGFTIYKNVFIFNWPLEKDYHPIEKILILNDQEIQLELSKYPTNTGADSSFVSISKIDSLNGIHLYHHKTKLHEIKQYVIPEKDFKHYNLIVNHCPINKVYEYNKFDNSALQKRKE